jgi:hypothetical protein
MKCSDCRFTLLCHMGRLGAGPKDGPQGSTQLCPKCGKFIYMPSHDEDPSTYVFFCELRPLTREIKREWAQLKARAAEVNHTTIAAIMVKDPGPGLPKSRAGDGRDLRIAECLACCHQLSMAPGVIWHDLDEDDLLRKERQPHAFALRYANHKKGRHDVDD